MVTEKNLSTDIKKGISAKSLLDDDSFKEAVKTLKATYIQGMLDTPIRDSEGRDILCLSHKVLDAIVQQLETVADGGTIAKNDLEELRKMKKEKRDASRTN